MSRFFYSVVEVEEHFSDSCGSIESTDRNLAGHLLMNWRKEPSMNLNGEMSRPKLLDGIGLAPMSSTAGSTFMLPAKALSENPFETPSILVFDVNETLIDIESIAPLFQRVFGDKKVLREWFGQLILYSDAVTMSGLYATYISLGQGLLEMLASIHGVQVKPSDVEELRTRMLTMSAHPDVEPGLKQLKDAGFRMVTCTNSYPNPYGDSPLEHAGIAHFFERQFSVDSVRAFKPSQHVYHMVSQELDVPSSSCCMVAAHVWDTIGAQSAGFAAALIARPGNAPLMVKGLPQPQAVGPDLPSVASQLIKMWRS
jgi:2-haloacid dehalogenase